MSNMEYTQEGLTQLQIIKKALEDGLMLNQKFVVMTYDIYRLSAHICTLKKQGMKIIGEWRKSNKKKYKVYYLTTTQA